VTVEGARRYGVVIADGKVDEAATKALRAEMNARPKPAGLFDRGFTSIEELKARCKAETGFDAPRAPTFRQQRTMLMAAE